MSAVQPLFKIRSDHFHVLQGTSYVSIDRRRVDSVHYHAGVLSVRDKGSGEVSLDCAAADPDDLMSLLRALERQRDHNNEVLGRAQKQNDVATIFPGFFG